MQTHVFVNMCRLSHASQFRTRSHVNKKALDQYVNFSEQREELVRRRDESIAGEAKIQQLITTLDMRKDEAIERTFKVGHLQVNLHLLALLRSDNEEERMCLLLPSALVTGNAIESGLFGMLSRMASPMVWCLQPHAT